MTYQAVWRFEYVQIHCGRRQASSDIVARATFPEIWNGLKFHSRVQSRRFLKEMGVPATLPGVDGVLHSMDFPDDVLVVASEYGEKLGKALHYFHTGKIVSRTAEVDAKVYTNANALSPDFPRQIFDFLNGEVEIRRASTSLKEQFDYRCVIVEEGEASAFAISFGESMVIFVSIFADAERHARSQIASRLS